MSPERTWYDERCRGRHHFCTTKALCDARGGRCRYIPLTPDEAASVREFWSRFVAVSVVVVIAIIVILRRLAYQGC